MAMDSASGPSSQVEISVSCRKLQNMDHLSKSDPLCVLFAKTFGSDAYQEIGRTEMVKNSLNPDFVKKFVMTYYFEQSQKLRFEIYDVDSSSAALSRQDFQGRFECTLGQIVGAPGNKLDKPLQGASKSRGTICVRAEELMQCKQALALQLSGSSLDKKDFLGKSDPFLLFYRTQEDGRDTVCHKTEVVKNNLNPAWRPLLIPLTTLCNGDVHRMIKIECHDFDNDGSHDLIGMCTTNVDTLLRQSSSGSVKLDLINPKKRAKKKSYKNSGVLNVLTCRLEVQHTFLDYIQGGTQINCVVAIDFTASNGNPQNPNSLHYLDPYRPNQYANAITSVCSILEDYDTDKQFPVLGFGAQIPPQMVVSHEFFVNGNPTNPYVQGVQGIYDAYYKCLQSCRLYGPTNFSPIINHVMRLAQNNASPNNYFVLLILTDGVITDIDYTIEAIVRASSMPISIIIVGVGDADFEAMDALDADDKKLYGGGRYAERDIVQFVAFRDFIGGKFGDNSQLSQETLARKVLAEIPPQLVAFMKMNNILPAASIQRPAFPPPAAAAV